MESITTLKTLLLINGGKDFAWREMQNINFKMTEKNEYIAFNWKENNANNIVWRKVEAW